LRSFPSHSLCVFSAFSREIGLKLTRFALQSTSTATVRPVTPSHIRFPTKSTHDAAPVLDSTNALPNESPTHSRDVPFPRSADRQYRTYSEADRLTLESLSIYSGDEESSSPEKGRSARERLSTGSMGIGKGVGAAIRSLTGLRGRRNTNPLDALSTAPVVEGDGGDGSSPEERRSERRKEVESILRRTARGSN
jgi:hypothetical protein